MTPSPIDQLSSLVHGEHTDSGDPLDAGAVLIVTNPDGSEAFRAPLARHVRVDEDDPHLIWIRPVVGGSEPLEPGQPYTFNLDVARRRSLLWTAATTVGGAVELQLRPVGDEPVGQNARIGPAKGEDLAMLKRWDTFIDQLEPREEAELARLDSDSWYGRFS